MGTITQEHQVVTPYAVRRGRPGSARPPRATSLDGVRTALREMLPVAVALVPFAMVLGVAIGASVVPDVTGALMAPVLYAGSANFAAVSVLDAGGTAVAAAFTAIVINARFAMYGAALAARFRGQPRWFRWLGPWMIVDQTFALAAAHDEGDPAWFRGYWLGCGALIGTVYTAMVVVGIVLGPLVPTGAGVELTIPSLFVALAVGQVRDRPALAAAVTGAAATVPALQLPNGLGLLVGALAGAAAGVITHRITDGRKST